MGNVYCMVRVILVGFFLACLWGCSSTPKADAIPMHEKQACEARCKVKAKACLRACDDSCKACEVREHHQMVQRYQDYVHEQCVQGLRTALQLQSFRDPLQCRKSSCNCPADFNVCMGACSGTIKKSLQVEPVCC